jgi:hypothetical protein
MDRIIEDAGKESIVVCTSGEMDHIYRRCSDSGNAHIKREGVPSDSSEFFVVPTGYPDSLIKNLVSVFEQGHSLGWREGQWKLRRDFQTLMGLPHP